MKTPPYALGATTFGIQGRPVMIGSLFYKGDKKVKDHRNGEVDCQRLKKEMKAICILGKKVGLDRAVDIIAETPCAMENYVNLLADMTDDALLIGGLNEETRIAGYRRAKDLGITGRCGVNSVSTCTTDEELAVLKETGIRFAILQTLDPSAVYPEEKIRLLREELLGKCVRGGIEGAAVDVGILDFTSAHLAVESIKMIRAELGLPAGCAPSNAAYQPLVNKKISRKSARSMNVALNTMMQMGGAEFILFGPLRASSYLFEATAVVEAVKAYGRRLNGEKITDKSHPLYSYLPKLQ